VYTFFWATLYVQVNSMLHFVHTRICLQILIRRRSLTSVRPALLYVIKSPP